MTNGERYVLDTNIVIGLLNNESTIQARATEKTLLIPLTVVGELYYGAKNAARAAENYARIERFALARAVLIPDLQTALEYAEIRHQLKRKGRPIPENDIWIAAIARQHQMILVSRDSHFEEVESLRLERW